jgi:hypothetical protein
MLDFGLAFYETNAHHARHGFRSQIKQISRVDWMMPTPGQHETLTFYTRVHSFLRGTIHLGRLRGITATVLNARLGPSQQICPK